jgi:hypothetical protein
MVRILMIACMLFSLATGACTANSREAPTSKDLKQDDAPKVDPLVFVLVYRTQIEAILKKHLGEQPDCDGALAELLRFIADHKEPFGQQVKDKPANWQPEGAQSDGPIQPLMEYSESCPDQVVRLNQALRSVLD